ncbi:hypothetical protein D9M68_800730 [compost metagenome]
MRQDGVFNLADGATNAVQLRVNGVEQTVRDVADGTELPLACLLAKLFTLVLGQVSQVLKCIANQHQFLRERC